MALSPTIGDSPAAAVADDDHEEVTMFAFVVMLSGATMDAIGWQFWGVLAGVGALVIASWRTLRRE